MTHYTNRGDGVMNIGGTMGHVVAGRDNQQTTQDVTAGSLQGLADELERLHQAVAAAHPGHDDDANAVQEARDAARSGDGGRARAALARTTRWLLHLAEAIGVQLVVDEIRGR